MGFFNRMRVATRVVREELKKNERDDIYADLQALGIDAQVAERGRLEEKIGGWGSLGLIDIPKGPISWVNVRKEIQSGEYGTSIDYYIDYGIPDPRLGPASPEIYIYSVRKKTFPLVGKVVDLHWEGRASFLSPIGKLGARIINRLKSDILIKYPLIKESYDVKIRASGDHGCWIIETKTRSAPSEELWNCYQTIAQHLLAEWPDQEAKWYCVDCGGGIRESDKVCPTCGVEL